MLNKQIVKFKKFLHYITLYGPRLTTVKVFSKINLKFKISLLTRPFLYYLDYSKKINVGIIGCGNHSFSSILFFYHYFFLGAWKMGSVGYQWSYLRCFVYRLTELKYKEMNKYDA